MDTVTVNGVEYVKKQLDAPVKIAVLQRGNVVVGRFERSENDCTLRDASVIRIWGTTKGLGEIAAAGPTAKTILDQCGTVHFDYLTAVMLIDCDEAKWARVL